MRRWRLQPVDWAAVALVAGALALRLWDLGGRSFWLDEVYTANILREESLQGALRYMLGRDDQAPLFLLLTWLLKGGSEAAIRLPSAIAGAAAVGVVYLIGRGISSAQAGLAAALALALSPFAVWYSQEARVYSLLMCLTALQWWLVFRLVRGRHPLDALALAAVSVASLYSSYLALLTTAAAIGYGIVVAIMEGGVAAVVSVSLTPGARPSTGAPTAAPSVRRRRRLVVEIGLPDGPPEPRRSAFRLLALVAVATSLTVLAYLPWIDRLRAFLMAPDLGVGRVVPVASVAIADVTGTLGSLGLGGWLLIPFVLGFVRIAGWCFTARWREGWLLALWLLLPAAVLGQQVGWAVFGLQPRYLSALVPAGVLMIGLGLDLLCDVGFRVFSQRSARVQGMVRPAALTLLALAMLPGLIAEFARPKEDYRAASRLLAASAGPGTVVFGLGSCGWMPVAALDYYFWRSGADMLIVDGRQLDHRVVEALRDGSGLVWGVVYGGCPEDNIELARTDAVRVTDFSGLILATTGPPDGTSGFARARLLMEWASAFRPDLRTAGEILGRLERGALGPNLLDQRVNSILPAAWRHDPGVSSSIDHSSFVLRPSGGEVNAILDMPAPGHASYLLTFTCQNGSLAGEQRVYVSAHDDGGAWLDVFPDGAGHRCPPGDTPQSRGFVFTLPGLTTNLTLWLRATGTGTAQYDEIALRRIH